MPELETWSAAFEEGAAIPARYTCDGEDLSPPLAWGDGPPGTSSFALVCEDPDAPGGTWVHWVAWNLTGTHLPAGVPPDGAPDAGMVQGTNSWGRRGYGGPCPPSGTHRYVFRIYALDTRLDLPAATDAATLRDAFRGHVLAEGRLMGRYARG